MSSILSCNTERGPSNFQPDYGPTPLWIRLKYQRSWVGRFCLLEIRCLGDSSFFFLEFFGSVLNMGHFDILGISCSKARGNNGPDRDEEEVVE